VAVGRGEVVAGTGEVVKVVVEMVVVVVVQNNAAMEVGNT